MIHYDTLFPSISTLEIQGSVGTDNESVSESLLHPGQVRCSQNISQIRSDWNRLVVSALSVASAVNPYESDLSEGTVIRAIDAVDWLVGRRNCDIRPRLIDKSSGTSRLVDSGSQITAFPPIDISSPLSKSSLKIHGCS